MAGLINHVKKWLGAAEPSSPLSLEIHGRKGKLEFGNSHSRLLKANSEFAKLESDFFQTEKSEKSSTMLKSMAMSSCSTHSTQGQLSRHGEGFSSLPLEMPQSDGALGELQRIHSEFVKTVKISVIRGLLDDLLQQKVFSTEDKDSVMESQKIKREKACCLIDMVTGKGETASQIMIDSLKKRDPDLCITLGLISSPACVGLGDDKTVVKPRKQKRENGGRKIKRCESEEKVANKKCCTVDESDSITKTCSAGQALTNKQLLQVAKTLGKEWEEAGINLDLKTKDLDDIKADGQMDVAMWKLKMLELWTRRRPPGKATAQDLLEGLKDMDLSVETKELLTDLMK